MDIESPREIIGGLVPEYPRTAEIAGIQGKVTISVDVSEEGKAFGVKVTSTSGHIELDYAAQVAAETLVFAPDSNNEVSAIQIVVNFSLGNPAQ